MDVVWADQKSARNREKHGVDFREALEIWQGVHLEIDGIARAVGGEERGATIGLIGGEVYVTIWTRRGECLRLISVRRARKNEKKFLLFDSEQEMDDYLEQSDLGDEFSRRGKLRKTKMRKINLDLPEWLLFQLDMEASRAGVSRQPLIKLWLIQRLDEEYKKRRK